MSSIKALVVHVPNERCPSYDELFSDASASRSLFVSTLRSVAQMCPGLEELRVDGCGLDFREEATLLAELPAQSLRRLTLENCKISDAHISRMDSTVLRRLEYLKIAFCDGLVDFLAILKAKLRASAENTKTDRMDESSHEQYVSPVDDTDEAMTVIEIEQREDDDDDKIERELRHKRLKSTPEAEEFLNFKEGEEPLEQHLRVSRAGDEPEYRLREMVLVHCPTLLSLKHLPRRLERLSLQSCYHIKDSDMLRIVKLPRLKYLLLSVNRLVTDSGLAALPLESLDEFHLHYWGIGVTQQGMMHVRSRCRSFKVSLCVAAACPALRDREDS